MNGRKKILIVSILCWSIVFRYFCTTFMFHVYNLHFVPCFYQLLRFLLHYFYVRCSQLNMSWFCQFDLRISIVLFPLVLRRHQKIISSVSISPISVLIISLPKNKTNGIRTNMLEISETLMWNRTNFVFSQTGIRTNLFRELELKIFE